MWPLSTPSEHAVLSLKSTRPSHRRHRRPRLELQLERLEDRQLLSGPGSVQYQIKTALPPVVSAQVSQSATTSNVVAPQVVSGTTASLVVSAGSKITTNAGSTVTFAGAVSGGTAPYTYSWNFGDGTTSAGNSASFTKTDTTTKGNWIGVYGAAGYNVIGSTSSYPSYATVTPSGESEYTYSADSWEAGALQTPNNPSDRISAVWYSPTSFTVDVNLTDGNVHPVSLYAMDETSARSEQIEVLNASSGAVLDTRTISSFSGGEYLTWNVSGHVQFVVTTLAGPNAVINGIFIGNATTTGSGSTTLDPTHVYANPGTYTATLTATDSAGHSGSANVAVTVNDVAPTVSLNDPSTGTVGTALSFTASATDVSPADQAAGFTYSWTFGDGGTATGASPSHTFASAGTYTVTAKATDNYGKTGTATGTIAVSGGLTVNAGSPLTVNAGSSVTFSQATESGGTAPFTYTWTFGDGTQQTGSLNPSHTYANPGSDTATVTVTDANKLTSSSSVVVTVNDVAPTASLSGPSSGTAGTSLSFTASATDVSPAVQVAGFTYAWNFGDGSTGTGASASHTYASAGTYTVTVSATDEYGKTGTSSETVVVGSSSALTVSAGGTVTTNAGSSVTFAGAVSGGTAPYTYSWNFGDGTTSAGTSASFTNADTTTQGNWIGKYGSAGYNVIGDSSRYPSYAVVTPSGESEYTYSADSSEAGALQTPENPSVRISAVWYSPTSFTVDVNLTDGNVHPVSLYAVDETSARSEQIEVLNVSSGAVLDTRTISSFSGGEYLTWNVSGHVQFVVTTLAGPNAVINGIFIGNATTTGSGSTTLDPTHVYANPGTYTATLTATDSAGHSGSANVAVTVNDVAPTVSLNDPSTGTVGTALSFTASATDVSPADQAAGFTYSWTFGDGGTATGASPSHTFASAGTYTVTAKATDKYGKTGTATGTIAVSGGLTVNAGSPLTVNAGSSVTFSQATESGGTAPFTYTWTFGDGTQQTGSLNPSHTYANPGSDTATVTVTDANKLTSSSSVAVTVNDVAPTVTFTDPPAVAGSPVSFTASATDVSPAVQAAGFTYAWNFGDGSTGSGATTSHTYASAGTYTVTVTGTDMYGKVGTASGTIDISGSTGATVIPITAAWLQQQGSAPYYLTQANATYELETNVTTSGTAFIVLANDITFNLNGYTVTYNNSAPMVVPNGGFETGTPGQAPPDWNVSQAPGATIVTPATENWKTGWWGNQLLQIPGITGTDTIVSSAIAIPQANRDYTAAISVKVPDVNNYEATVALSVIDTVTGAVLGTADSPAADRGYAPTVTFTPTTTDPVELKVTITAVGGQTFIADADYASVVPSGDSGIVASPLWWELGSQLQTPTVEADAGHVLNVTIENGTVTEGQSRSYGGADLFLEGNGDNVFTVQGMTLSFNGDNSTAIDGYWTSGATVLNNTITGNMLRVADRMHDYWAINIQRATGAIDIQGNTISGTMVGGIVVTGLAADSATNFSSVIIDHNNIAVDELVTDSYAIGFAAGVNAFEIAYNTIDQPNGRGILLDGIDSGIVTDGTIHDNTVDVQEQPNLEYGQTALEATALRIRAVVGTVSDVDIYNNTFYAQTSVGDDWSAVGARISFSNGSGQNANSDVILQNNTFEGIVVKPDPNLTGSYSSTAYGLSVSGVDAGTGLQLLNNTFVSNDTSLNFGDSDSYGESENDITFIGNTIEKASTGAAMTYTGIAAGNWANTTNNIRLINMSYTNGATPGVTFLGIEPENITIGWLLNVTVTNSSGAAVAGANVTVLGANNQVVYAGTTNAQGQITGIMVLTTEYVQQGTNPDQITTDNLGPFTVQTTSGTTSQSQSVNLTGDLNLGITLD